MFRGTKTKRAALVASKRWIFRRAGSRWEAIVQKRASIVLSDLKRSLKHRKTHRENWLHRNLRCKQTQQEKYGTNLVYELLREILSLINPFLYSIQNAIIIIFPRGEKLWTFFIRNEMYMREKADYRLNGFCDGFGPVMGS